MLRGAFDKEHVDGGYRTLEPFIRHRVATRGQRWGYQFAHVHEDTMLLSYTVDETGGIHGLEVLANDLIGAPHWKGVIEQYLPKKGASYANVPPEVLYLYQAKDLGVTFQIFPILRSMVASDAKLERLYTEHLIPSSETLAWIESNGVCADQEVMARNDVSIKQDIEKYLKVFQDRSEEVVGFRCNPNSWQQVQKFFYKGGLDIAGNGKVLATDAKTLQAFPEVPEVKMLQDCRETIKLYGQYVEGMRNAIEPDGRIHTNYLLHGTTTGRLASRNPNLQNIVRDNRIKDQFRAADGKWLLSNDLSQAELRVLACLSGDKVLCEIFNSGISIHPIVAKRFYGASYTEDQYQLAKAVTFGIVYGRDAFSIALEYQITVKEAQAYIDSWFGQFPDAKKFIQACRVAPLSGKILQTPWGRKRRFGIVGQERIHDVGNQAANFPEQSMASDITLETANIITPTLKKWGVKIVNLVHDDIIKEIPQREDLVMDTIALCHKHFKEVPIRRGLTKVPFEAEWKIGTHWGSLKKKKELPIDFFTKVQYNQ
jgi:DNA polymerase-1